jgi:RNA polymerase sigma factor (TIGR02999 family)
MDTAVTELLDHWRNGDQAARDRLVELLYPQLRRLAAQLFRGERNDHTLQPTALVNEAWLRLAGSGPLDSTSRSHLITIAARLMREILIDHARRRARVKRDGGERVTLTRLDGVESGDSVDLINLDAVLARLEQIDAAKARIVELRYFGGLSIEETAAATDQSPATVKRHWQAARLWLFDALGREAGTPD